MAQKQSGFTFAEVLISLAILTSAVYIYSGLQFRSSMKLQRSAHEIERVFFVKRALYRLFISPQKKRKLVRETLDEPEMTVVSQTQSIDEKKSSLKAFSKDIDIIASRGEWDDGRRKRMIKMISFAPKQKKKKK